MELFTSSKSLLVIIIVFIPIACLIGRLFSINVNKKHIRKGSYYAVTDKLKNDILKDAQIPLLRGFNNQSDINTISYSINKIYLEKGL